MEITMKNLIIILVGILTLSACSDFLEEKSQDEVIVSTVSDYSQFLLGSAYGMSGYDVLYLLDDDVELDESLYYGDANNAYAVDYFGYFTWQPDMCEREVKITDLYENVYSQLKGVNATLDGIDEATGADVEREYVKAEAYGLRGFYYYLLVNLYGEPYHYNKTSLGVPLKLTAGLVENGLVRNTVEEVYLQIVKDLKVSAELFEKNPKRVGNYRLNVTSVYILLSRVYLYMEQWENAIKAADRAIETAEGLTNYTLVSSSTFYMPTYAHSEVEWRYGNGQLKYGYIPSRELLSKYSDNDCRKKFWFNASGKTTKKTPDYSEGMGPTNTLRISEAYLNRAEAYAQMDKASEALADLNDLRRCRIVGYEDISIENVTDILDEVRLERRLELCYDEQRWFDLRRYGMPSISHKYKAKKADSWLTFTLKEKDLLYTIPFSTTMIMNNNRLEQNPSAYEPERKGI
ncbi:glycan metabolism protein RagB [Odoribacteraceae bacterium]|nr:glycan metabolism protein RagB [Odoribacteraceae bacterium]GKH94418.1 glycan metabolism protein RagB [Odoribacteraceae bacterium]GKH98698.1 glycan metabolism protein RagB [Odoribacteraceae bacterium]GKI02164.1 glycan metabolism protein RagB [Odoribacteraceae bacterium]